MAAVLIPKSLCFPHSILHDNIDATYSRMERNSPSKPSLPSISSLISDIDKHVENGSQKSPGIDQQRISAGSYGQQPPTPDRISVVGSPRNGLPPTPPLPGASSFDFSTRPPANIAGSPMTPGNSQNGCFARSPSTTNPEAYAQHRSSYPPVPNTTTWNSPGSPPASRRASNEELGQMDGAQKQGSCYPDPAESNSPYLGLAQQRPLPANFPPSVPPPGQQLPPIDPQMAAQYQHHHHYPVSNGTAFPQSTDRYQCPTCQKAFSRPSSLKIHTYSHTGEKPFKCKYEGCGKYFSVRSNMKRHEKGCHGAETSSAGGNSPKTA